LIPTCRCPYCQQIFRPSAYRLHNVFAVNWPCRRRRRAEHHRQKIQTDPLYAEVVCDSRKQWRAEHAEYQKTYWQTHPDAATDLPSGCVRDTQKLAVFRVSRVWKGEVGETFEMPAVEETSACTGFWPKYLKVGSDLLVYARRFGSQYYTSICGSHKLARDANNKDAKDFEVLGPGEVPQKKNDQNSK
jgi:hypothetical protein